jgi:hypothetical protein
MDFVAIIQEVAGKINISKIIITGGVLAAGVSIGDEFDSIDSPEEDPSECGCDKLNDTIKANFLNLCNRIPSTNIPRRNTLRSICNGVTDLAKLQALSTKMVSLNAELFDFLDNLNDFSVGSCLTDPIANHIGSLDIDFLNNWLLIRNNAGGRLTNEIKNYTLYEALDLFNTRLTALPISSIKTVYGNPISESTYDQIGQKVISMYVGVDGYISGGYDGCLLNSIEIFNTFLTQFSTKTGSRLLLAETLQSGKKLKGGLFTMLVASSPPQSDAPWGNVSSFEEFYSGDNDSRMDIEFAGKPFVETKNWVDSYITGNVPSTGFADQFGNYISRITSLNNLAYVFKNRGNVDTTLIKNAFQKLYQARDYAIFDTFWNNVGANGLSGLRLSLFGIASTNPTQQQVGIAKDSFMSWVNNFDIRLYSFINIK